MGLKYEELVIEGPTPLSKGFLYGLVFGKGLKTPIIINSERSINRASLEEFIKEWIGHLGNIMHVIVTREAADEITSAINSLKDRLEIEVKSRKTVEKASFEFEYKAYAPFYGDLLQAFFKDLPDGVSLSEDYKPEVTKHPDAVGAEGYAPEHDYEIEAHGTVTGPLIEILELHKKADDEVLIEVEGIDLIFE